MLTDILLFLQIIINILFLLFFIKNSKDLILKITFSGYIFSISIWIFFIILTYRVPQHVDLISRIDMSAIVLAPFFLLLFIKKLFNRKSHPFLVALSFLLLFTLIYCIIFTNILIENYSFNSSGKLLLKISNPTAIKIYLSYYVFILIYICAILVKEYKLALDQTKKILIKALFYSIVSSYLLNFLIIGIATFLMGNVLAKKISTIPFLSISFVLSYSILRYQIFKIKLIVKESLIYSGGFAFFSILITGFAYLLGKNIFRSLESTLWLMLSAVFLTNIFQNQIKNFFNTFFNKDKLNFEDSLAHINKEFGRVLELKNFQAEVGKVIATLFKPIEQKLIILPSPKQNYIKKMPAVILEQKEEQLGNYCADLENCCDKEYDIILPLVYNQKILGFIFLNLDKKYLNFTKENLELLGLFSQNISLALANSLSIEELKQKQSQLFQSEKLASLGQLVAGIAHEIRNPLTGMTLALDNIKYSLLEAGYKDEKFERYFETCLHSIERLKGLLSNLLEYAKKSELEFRIAEINKLIMESLIFIQKQAAQSRIKIITSFKKEHIHCRCDSRKIQQVLINLLVNALQALGTNGEIIIETDQTKNATVINVTDNGPGMDEDKIKNIFDPFYTTKEEGTGLGLAICQEIIEKHGGKLKVKSKPGNGTTFSIILKN